MKRGDLSGVYTAAWQAQSLTGVRRCESPGTHRIPLLHCDLRPVFTTGDGLATQVAIGTTEGVYAFQMDHV